MAGNAGNAGNVGNSGSGTSGGGGGPQVFADRTDLPFAFDILQGESPLPAKAITAVATYPDKLWDQQWLSWLVLQDFASEPYDATSNPLPLWARYTFPHSRIPINTANELETLAGYAVDERPDALGEILAQSEEFVSYFINVLGINTTAFANTRQLLHVGNLVGLFTVMYYKKKFNRVRPSQLMPALAPPIAIPGHASYPSGHSTQAHLIAKCVELALPKAAAGTPPPFDTNVALTAALDKLAYRIARNREIAGLHYPSDTSAGIDLADFCLGLLQSLASFQAIIAAAKMEWQ